MLRAWAALDLPNGYWPGQRPKDMPRNFFRLISGKWWTHFQTKLGTTHGVGILMLVARLDTKGTGTLQAAEEAAFIKDADVLVEQLLGFATTSMVIAMLTISIAIPLCVYQLSTVTPDELIAVPSLGGGWLQPPDWYGAWMGSAALHVLYWVEALILAVSISLGGQCILACNFLYMNLSVVFPDTEPKVYFMVDNILTVLDTFLESIGCMQLLLLALPMLAARLSPVAGICMCYPILTILPVPIPVISFWFAGGNANMENRMYCSPAVMQLQLVREILRKADAKEDFFVNEDATIRTEPLEPLPVDGSAAVAPRQAVGSRTELRGGRDARNASSLHHKASVAW